MAAGKGSNAQGRGVLFRVVNTRKQQEPEPNLVVLERDLWDDFGYRCSFRVLASVDRAWRLLGTWKVLDRQAKGPRTTELPRRFSSLAASYVGLGQDLRAYEQVANLPHDLAIGILAGLRDAVFHQSTDLAAVDGFERAMVRFARASDALARGRVILERSGVVGVEGSQDTPLEQVTLHVSAQLEGFPNRHVLDLPFRRSHGEFGLRRVVVIVGPNGSGKTQLLAALARGLSGLTARTIELHPPKPFPQVVAVSYGAFDHFTHPRISGADISYVYCGLRVDQKSGTATRGTKIVLDLESALERGASDIVEVYRGDRSAIWEEALDTVRLSDLAEAARRGRNNVARFMRQELSAGQKLVALTLTNLTLHLRPRALVLHDEPETHLHPALLAALLRAMHKLLEATDAYAVVATHSLIPLQETPSSNVVILDRPDDGTVQVLQPAEQCFASTLDEISRVAFRTGANEENFRSVLSELRKRFDVEHIRELLGGELGLGTKLQLASIDR